MDPSSPVAIAVINYNTREFLRRCLASLDAAGAGTILVIDNASSDGSADMVRSDFPQVRLVVNPSNAGFGKGVNDAIRNTGGCYALILNADTRFVSGSLAEATRYLDDRPEVAILGPALINPDGSSQRSFFPFPGTMAWLCENDPLGPILRHVPPLRRRMRRYLPRDRPVSAAWVIGAAMLVRRTAFEQVGGVDESYFMYFEEVDLCYRLRKAGWKVHYAPLVTFEHVGEASTSQQRAAMITQHFHSTQRFYRRYYRGLRLWVWLNLMRVKLLACTVQAAGTLVLPASAEDRATRKTRLQGWTNALFDTHRRQRGPTS